jgi:hypothetical protein
MPIQLDPKTFDPFDPKYVEPDRPHGPVNLYGEWEWEQWNGTTYLVLWRDTGLEPCPTDLCPFCGNQHYHGKGEGGSHKSAHCWRNEDPQIKPEVVLSDGTTVYYDDSYIVRNRKEPR